MDPQQPSTTNKPTLFSDYTIDIMPFIFVHLKINELISCLSVSKLFNKFASNDNLFKRQLYDDFWHRIVLFQENYYDTYKLHYGLTKLKKVIKSEENISQLYYTRQLTLYSSSHVNTTMPTELCLLRDLRYLQLSFNNFTRIPSEIGQLQNLTTIIFEHNMITSFPSELCKLQNLTNLHLAFNMLESLPTEFGQLHKLEVVDLQLNILTQLPSEIGNLLNLKDIDLNYNKLTSIPSEIGKLKKLKRFVISNNHITRIPQEIQNMDIYVSISNQLKPVTFWSTLELLKDTCFNIFSDGNT
jgi:Leucine-rich repeat (LRR) protein